LEFERTVGYGVAFREMDGSFKPSGSRARPRIPRVRSGLERRERGAPPSAAAMEARDAKGYDPDNPDVPTAKVRARDSC